MPESIRSIDHFCRQLGLDWSIECGNLYADLVPQVFASFVTNLHLSSFVSGLPNGTSITRYSTNIDAKLCMQFGIFLELPRVCEGSRGFLRTSMFGRVARKRLFLLSPGHFSLRPRHPEVARSPQSPRLTSLYINELRADESSGCFLASAGDGNRPDSESGECIIFDGPRM